MATAWACCCFKTGMHAARHAVASKAVCVLHGMPLRQQQQLPGAACMRGCVAAFVIDTIYQLTRRRRPRPPPELALLSVPINLEYFYTKIRFSTPDLSALLSLAGQIYLYFLNIKRRFILKVKNKVRRPFKTDQEYGTLF
jgi:hypothetical protein